jgi:hypothetical protein
MAPTPETGCPAIELTQWTLMRRRALGEARRDDGIVWLKPPGEEPRPFALASLPADLAAELRTLASGSKIPKDVLARILLAEAAL